MARTKTVTKNAPMLRNGENTETDFTYNEVNRCVIRFNRAAVVYLEYNSETDAVSVLIDNELTGVTKTLTGTAEQEA